LAAQPQQSSAGFFANLMSTSQPQREFGSKTQNLFNGEINNSGDDAYIVNPSLSAISQQTKAQSPMKPVNLLPEVPTTTTIRKLSAREQRDCEVIERLIKSYFF